MNLETPAVYFRGIRADVRARGRNNKPPPSLSASEATGGMYTRRGDLLFMYKKKYNHTHVVIFQPYGLYYCRALLHPPGN